MRGDLRGAQRAVPHQQPAQVAAIPPGLPRVAATLRGRERSPVDGEGVIDDPPAGVLQVLPLPLVVRHQRITRRPWGEMPSVHQGANARIQGAGGVVVAGQHGPGGRLPHPPGLHPVLRQHRPRQGTGTAADPTGGHEHGDVPQPDQIRLDGARGVHLPMRVDLPGQPGQQIGDQRRITDPAGQPPPAAAVAELARDPQRIAQQLCRHHTPPPSVSVPSVSNSVPASRAAAARAPAGAPIAACSYASA